MDETFWTAAAAVVAAAALSLSLVNFFAGRERLIGWTAQRSQVRDGSNHFRLRNDSRGVRARVLALSDNFDGAPGETMVFDFPTLPAVVEPSNWLPISAHQILGQEPIAITIHWEQSRLGSAKFKTKVYSTTVYL